MVKISWECITHPHTKWVQMTVAKNGLSFILTMEVYRSTKENFWFVIEELRGRICETVEHLDALTIGEVWELQRKYHNEKTTP